MAHGKTLGYGYSSKDVTMGNPEPSLWDSAPSGRCIDCKGTGGCAASASLSIDSQGPPERVFRGRGCVQYSNRHAASSLGGK